MAERRTFLAGMLAASALPGLTWADIGGDGRAPAYLAAAKEPDGRFALFGLSAAGASLFRVALPGRGHAAAAHPTAPEAVAFARRPGVFALVIDCAAGRVTRRLEAPAGRHFYGHGAFVSKGEILCTPENDIESGMGRIGIWSRPDGYERIGEIASNGIGPHDVKALADDKSLVVANGGIRTHPDTGREKLNIETMRPNLTYLTLDGKVVDEVELEEDLHKNSIRHLALGPGGLVAFAMQWQGDLADAPPLLGLHRQGEAAQLLSADLAEQISMRGYAGSVAVDWPASRVAITSPRGGRVHMFDLSGAFMASIRRADICGLGAPATHGSEGFLATDGLGGVLSIKGERTSVLAATPRAWDNHLVAI